ncbi:biotin transporter BioY [Marinicella gelatinilytica]|uniref:biotin transporter BioY n=1 Tax=Marinicella gelatinilytica TaxID=2996017 RepID=UPI002260AC14|nr:biotin transporter BioY [Marinicella gelatinilytica]MCX7545336.1 biotin transporter BioY [Marinicella gelatinilytica]
MLIFNGLSVLKRINNQDKMLRILQLILGVVALGFAAQIAINLGSLYPVPITAQSMVVLMIAHLYQWKWGSACIFIYLLVGLLGLPVFSNFSGGWAAFSGKSMGFLLGFFFAALVVGKMAEKQDVGFLKVSQQFFIGSLVILLCGYLGLLRFLDVKTAFIKGVVPFLPGMIIKVFVGALLIIIMQRFRCLMKQS